MRIKKDKNLMRKVVNYVGKKLKDSDGFGHPIGLMLDSDTTFKTKIGGVATLI